MLRILLVLLLSTELWALAPRNQLEQAGAFSSLIGWLDAAYSRKRNVWRGWSRPEDPGTFVQNALKPVIYPLELGLSSLKNDFPNFQRLKVFVRNNYIVKLEGLNRQGQWQSIQLRVGQEERLLQEISPVYGMIGAAIHAKPRLPAYHNQKGFPAYVDLLNRPFPGSTKPLRYGQTTSPESTGEDAYALNLILDEQRNPLYLQCAVADGVGGANSWRSAQLAHTVTELMVQQPAGDTHGSRFWKSLNSALWILQYENPLDWKLYPGQGAATFSFMRYDFQAGQLEVRSIGDSSVWVIHVDGNVRKSPKAKNLPLNVTDHLSMSASSRDTAKERRKKMICSLEPGDFVLVFTDGLGDNLSEEDIKALVEEYRDQPRDLAQVLKNTAKNRFESRSSVSASEYAIKKAAWDALVAENRELCLQYFKQGKRLKPPIIQLEGGRVTFESLPSHRASIKTSFTYVLENNRLSLTLMPQTGPLWKGTQQGGVSLEPKEDDIAIVTFKMPDLKPDQLASFTSTFA